MERKGRDEDEKGKGRRKKGEGTVSLAKIPAGAHIESAVLSVSQIQQHSTSRTRFLLQYYELNYSTSTTTN